MIASILAGLPLWLERLEKLERLERLERLEKSIFFAVKCLDWLENDSFLWSEKYLKGTPLQNCTQLPGVRNLQV